MTGRKHLQIEVRELRMEQDGVEVYCIPDNACCNADSKKRSPLEIDECPMFNEVCNGNCEYYCED